jgi:hypothetical protein
MHSHRIASAASSHSCRRAGLRFNVLPAAGETIVRSRSLRLGLTPSARSIFRCAILHRATVRLGRLSCGSCSLQHTLACIPLSEAASSGRSRFDVFGVTSPESTGIDQHFPRTCDDPSVHAVFRAIDRDNPPGDSPASVSTPARQRRAAVVAMTDRDQACRDPDITLQAHTLRSIRAGSKLTHWMYEQQTPARILRPGLAIESFPAGSECDRLTALLGFSTLLKQGLPFAGLLPPSGGSRE